MVREKMFLLLLFFTLPLIAVGQLRGVVVDETGMPIAGAVVQTKIGNISTTTDFDGKFEINVPYGAELEVALLGYKKQTLLATRNMHIVLQEKKSKTKKTDNTAWKMFVLANGMTAVPFQPAVGITLGMVKKGGWYFNFMTGFGFNFDVANRLYMGRYYDNTYSHYDTPFYTGKKSEQTLSLTMGGVAKFGKSEMYFYYGGGYGFKSIALETNNYKWIVFENDNFANAYSPMHSLALEVGLMGNIKGFAISAGYETMLGFPDGINVAHELKIGIGGMFEIKRRTQQ